MRGKKERCVCKEWCVQDANNNKKKGVCKKERCVQERKVCARKKGVCKMQTRIRYKQLSTHCHPLIYRDSLVSFVFLSITKRYKTKTYSERVRQGQRERGRGRRREREREREMGGKKRERERLTPATTTIRLGFDF